MASEAIAGLGILLVVVGGWWLVCFGEWSARSFRNRRHSGLRGPKRQNTMFPSARSAATAATSRSTRASLIISRTKRSHRTRARPPQPKFQIVRSRVELAVLIQIRHRSLFFKHHARVQDRGMQLDPLTFQVFLDVMAIPAAAILISFCYLLTKARRKSPAVNRANRDTRVRLVQKIEV